MEPTEGAGIPPLRGVCVQTSAYEDGAWRHTAASCLGSEGLRGTHACGSRTCEPVSGCEGKEEVFVCIDFEARQLPFF